MYYTERPGKPALVETTWRVYVVVSTRETRRMETGMTHSEAADMMKQCRSLFPKSVIICTTDKIAEQIGHEQS
jgi:hypothetical protein